MDGNQGFGITCPLITTASGAKMGKTVGGAVWLNADKKSPYEFWQFWRNTEDADVGRFLRLFSDLPLAEIERLEALEGAEINDAKIALADAATTMLHGEQAAKDARESAAKVFQQGASGDALPTYEISKGDVEAGMLVAAGFTAAALTKSNGEARRSIKQNAAKLNGESVSDENATLSLSDFDADGLATLSIGKKRHARLQLA